LSDKLFGDYSNQNSLGRVRYDVASLTDYFTDTWICVCRS